MTASTTLEKLTLNQPFCGGVCIWHESRMVFTIARQRRWTTTPDGRLLIPVAWVGGGQEIGESVRECALREAVEELGCPISLISSPDTFWFDNGRVVRPKSLSDPVVPVLIETRFGLNEPYKAGLPVGPTVYVVIYRAKLLGKLTAGDVPGVIEVPIEHCRSIDDGIPVHQAKKLGVPIHEKLDLPDDGILRFVSNGPEELLVQLWTRGLLSDRGVE